MPKLDTALLCTILQRSKIKYHGCTQNLLYDSGEDRYIVVGKSGLEGKSKIKDQRSISTSLTAKKRRWSIVSVSKKGASSTIDSTCEKVDQRSEIKEHISYTNIICLD